GCHGCCRDGCCRAYCRDGCCRDGCRHDGCLDGCCRPRRPRLCMMERCGPQDARCETSWNASGEKSKEGFSWRCCGSKYGANPQSVPHPPSGSAEPISAAIS